MRRCLDCHQRIVHARQARLCPVCARARELARMREFQRRQRMAVSQESVEEVEALFARVAQARRRVVL